MKDGFLIHAINSIPWAITENKLRDIELVAARHALGAKLTPEEIADKIGAKKENRDPYLIEIEAFGEHAARSKTVDPAPARKMIAVLPVYGIIAPKASEVSEVSGPGGTGIDSLTSQFRQALADPNVTSILFDFDSPGGSVYGVDELWSEIFAARDKKRIVAQVNPVCASAAYYLASACSEIACLPSGDVGSVGVRAAHVDVSEALKAKGIKVTHITSSKYKAEGAPEDPLSEEGRAYMQQRVDEYHEMFITALHKGRGVSKADLNKNFGQGRMMLAPDAKRAGMIDRLATFDQTIARLGGNTSAQPTPLTTASALADPAAPLTAAADAPTPAALPLAAGPALVPVDSAQVLRVLASILPSATTSSPSANNSTTGDSRNQGGSTMPPVEAADATATEQREKFALEAERVSRINQLAGIHGLTDKVPAWIRSGATIETVQAEILGLPKFQPKSVPAASAEELDGGITVVADAADKRNKDGLRIGRWMRAVAYAMRTRTGPAGAARICSETYGDAALGRQFLAVDGQAASQLATGGFIVPQTMAQEVIEFLRPAAIFRKMRPTEAPLVNGNLSLPKITAGAVASYVGELQPAPSTNVQGGQVKATTKKLMALAPISNDLLRVASISADAMVRDDVVLALAQAEDGAFIRGAGTQYTPKGIRNWAVGTNVVPSILTTAEIAGNTDAENLAAVEADLSGLRLLLRKANVKFRRPGWLFGVTAENFLQFKVRNAIGNRVIGEQMEAKGTVFGFPYASTTLIPENLGTGGSDSEIYLADFADVVICDAPTIQVEISTEASYVGADGNTYNAFQDDQTLLRFIEEHDLVVRHDQSIAILTAVEYA